MEAVHTYVPSSLGSDDHKLKKIAFLGDSMLHRLFLRWSPTGTLWQLP